MESVPPSNKGQKMLYIEYISNTKKILLSLSMFLASLGYSTWIQGGGTFRPVDTVSSASDTAGATVEVNPLTPAVNSSDATTSIETGTFSLLATYVPESTSTPLVTKKVPAPTPLPPKPIHQYVDGTYTGTVADAFYGYIQVEVFIRGGKLADVQFLQYPNDRRTSQEINSQAMPILRSEALQAQHATVDTVSGATDTSAAFIESLSAALLQARV